MAITNVPSPSFGPQGFIAPAEAEILAGILTDFQAAFGSNLNPSLTTPQGQLATSEAAIVGNVNDTFVFYTNQVDPAYAQGRMQDAIARIYFLERLPAEPTVLEISCSGLAGVVIPINAIIQDSSGNLYLCTQSGTIPVSGSITLTFAAQIPGQLRFRNPGMCRSIRLSPVGIRSLAHRASKGRTSRADRPSRQGAPLRLRKTQ